MISKILLNKSFWNMIKNLFFFFYKRWFEKIYIGFALSIIHIWQSRQKVETYSMLVSPIDQVR